MVERQFQDKNLKFAGVIMEACFNVQNEIFFQNETDLHLIVRPNSECHLVSSLIHLMFIKNSTILYENLLK